MRRRPTAGQQAGDAQHEGAGAHRGDILRAGSLAADEIDSVAMRRDWEEVRSLASELGSVKWEYRAQAQLGRELGDGRQAEAELATAADLVPAGEVAAMIEAPRGIERRGHDGIRSAHAHVTVAHGRARPHGKLRAGLGDRAIADQQAHEIALVSSIRTNPGDVLAVVLQQHLVAGLEIARRAPTEADKFLEAWDNQFPA